LGKQEFLTKGTLLFAEVAVKRDMDKPKDAGKRGFFRALGTGAGITMGCEAAYVRNEERPGP